MVKFEVHASPQEMHLDHRTAPGRTCNPDQNRLRTKFGMAGDQRLVLAQDNRRIRVMLGLDVQHCSRGKLLQENPALNLRTHDVAVHLIAEVGMGPE